MTTGYTKVKVTTLLQVSHASVCAYLTMLLIPRPWLEVFLFFSFSIRLLAILW